MFTRDGLRVVVREKIVEATSSSPWLASFLAKLASHGRVAIVGGAVRDWMFGRSPRDLDFVVDCDPAVLDATISARATRRNRFGGFFFDRPDLKLDVWSLASTWAFNHASIVPNFERLPSFTFLNVEGVAVALDDFEVFEHGFFDGIIRRRMSINFAPNLFPERCVVRGLVLAERHEFAIDSDLAEYMRVQFREGLDVERMMAVQRNIYGTVEIDAETMRRRIRSVA